MMKEGMKESIVGGKERRGETATRPPRKLLAIYLRNSAPSRFSSGVRGSTGCTERRI